MSTSRPLCLVVPCYNEAERLPSAAILAWLTTAPAVRIIFVDDGSVDETLVVLKTLEQQLSDQVCVLPLTPNGGKAEAVRAGILYALQQFSPEFVGYWDADLATPLPAVEEFLKVLRSNPAIEMVFGARVKLLGRHVERRPLRHYLGRIFATTVSNVLNLAIYDTQCGAKIFRVTPRTIGVFEEPFLSKWVFDVEIIARYLRAHGGIPAQLANGIYEFPLEKWVDIAGSKVKPGDFFTALLDIARIRRRYLLPSRNK